MPCRRYSPTRWKSMFAAWARSARSPSEIRLPPMCARCAHRVSGPGPGVQFARPLDEAGNALFELVLQRVVCEPRHLQPPRVARKVAFIENLPAREGGDRQVPGQAKDLD